MNDESDHAWCVMKLSRLKARDAKIREFIKRQAEDCLVMAKHDDLINPKNEAEIWLKALLLLEERVK